MITSPYFWGLLLPAVGIHWLLPQRFRAWFLFLASAGTIATLDWKTVASLLVFSALFYVVGQRFERRPPFLIPSLVLGVLFYLAYFKYVPVFEGLVKPKSEVAASLIVPLGASYYTFKLVHYIVETGRKNIPPHGIDAFLSYMFFFPMFTAGPIERFDTFLVNRAERASSEAIVDGLTRVAYGLVKKLVIVDLVLARTMAREPRGVGDFIPIWSPAPPLEGLLKHLDQVSPFLVWKFVATQFLSVYLDFSAYSDIAIGTGLLFGVRLMENFDSPLFVTNISDFWRRWHISLSTFCQQYVYMPVIGRTRNPYIAIFLTMAAIGLWHAASWNYLCWGLFHATFLVIYLSWGRLKRRQDWEIQSRALGVAGGVFTFLMCSAAQSFVSTKDQGIRPAARLLCALVGVHLPAEAGSN